MLTDPQRYLKGKTPPGPTEGETLPVEISCEIWAILDIQEVAQLTKIQFQLSLQWYDGRLQYFNLKDDQTMNTVVFEETQKIWVPGIIFQNTESQKKSQNDDESRMMLSKGKITRRTTRARGYKFGLFQRIF